MSFWLRKVKSTIDAPNFAQGIDWSLRVNKRASQSPSASSVGDLRRRLARKVSTLSVRGKSQHGIRNPQLSTEQDNDKDHGSSGVTITPGAPSTAALPPETVIAELDKTKPPTPPPKDSKLDSNSVKVMASETSSPPIPFIRLKEIATEACDAALSSVTKYTHASTESWNTSIINSVLTQLVKESSSSGSQPQWKFIVNSTIIQHAPLLSGAEGDVSGRRGMHSASGAFWNNEKDGMWSFKYAAAEGKGLDVVVGVNWIWVG